MRQAVTSWLVVASCLVLLGGGTVIGAKVTRGAPITVAMMQQWRQYATDVEHGKRTPSAMTTRMLTETAIAQHEYANAAERLLLVVGAGVAVLGCFLAADLARYRMRHLPLPPPAGE